MELFCLEFFPIVVDKEIATYFELKCVFTVCLHPVEENQDHAEKTTHVGKSSIETCVRAIILQDEVCLSEEDSDEFVSVDDLEVADHWSFIQGDSLLTGDIRHWLRKDAAICVDLVLREEDVAADAHHICELEVRSIFQHVI